MGVAKEIALGTRAMTVHGSRLNIEETRALMDSPKEMQGLDRCPTHQGIHLRKVVGLHITRTEAKGAGIRLEAPLGVEEIILATEVVGGQEVLVTAGIEARS